jgi:hypothetical protein
VISGAASFRHGNLSSDLTVFDDAGKIRGAMSFEQEKTVPIEQSRCSWVQQKIELSFIMRSSHKLRGRSSIVSDPCPD